MTYFNCVACAWRVMGPGRDGLVVFIEERAQIDGRVFYAIVKDGWVANESREWEYEPIPSSRTDDFITRTRFYEWSEAAEVAQHMAASPSLWAHGRRLEPRTAAELADQQIARFQKAIDDGTGNPDVCRDQIDRWLDHRIDHGDEPRQPL